MFYSSAFLNKLVQNKRGKMLILATILSLAVLVKRTQAINLTYIVAEGDGDLRHGCLAELDERYDAVAWVYPIGAASNITTTFVPHTPNAYNCKFSKNDRCNLLWTIKNWALDDNSTRTHDLILDERWEDFPTILTDKSSKNGPKERIEVPSIFRAGFSLRSSESVELLVCEGWSPQSYPCYHLNMTRTGIYLRKFMMLPEDPASGNIIDSYRAFSDILSESEWRSFTIRFDDNGTLTLNDISTNRTVIQYQDKEPLKPLYLLPRSEASALWKFHQNQFMFTKAAQISRLGPVLHTASRDLCVSLYVSLCDDCVMTFMIMKGNQRNILRRVTAAGKEFEWKLVQLVDENLANDIVTIFVETKYFGDNNQTDGFWAIDDVRVCHKNEVKVTFLRLQTDDEEAEDEVSCQIVKNPMWRPEKVTMPELKDFPTIESSPNSTSIELKWKQEDFKNQISYFITYQANDICESEPHNKQRVKSTGFLKTNHPEITIADLIPYTKYNITITSMLHEKEKNYYATTLESDPPSPEELPNRVQVQVTTTTAYVSWDRIDCVSIYGHILYSMTLTDPEGGVRNLSIQSENGIKIDNLKPYTLYNMNIATGRSFEGLQDPQRRIETSVNFTTPAGTAPTVHNLEVYSTDKNSVSLRYNLPDDSHGVPVHIQVTRCNRLLFKKCKSAIFTITTCKFWPSKYCLDVNNLIPFQNHTFKVSIKNNYTPDFGDEVQIEVETTERVPAPPTNITYKIVDCKSALDYCHLNITWLHPYNQNATITHFNILLNGTDTESSTESIQEIMKITNKTYTQEYQYQIKYIPYSTHYELYVQSANGKYKSEYAHVHVATAHLGDHIDQNPQLMSKSDTTVTFKIPPVDHRLKSYNLTVVVQDFDNQRAVPGAIAKDPKVADHLCHSFGDAWVGFAGEITNSTSNITLEALKPQTKYCVAFIVTNNYKGTSHDVVYYNKLETAKLQPVVTAAGKYSHLYILLLLLLLIPIGFGIHRYMKRRRPKPKAPENKENVYESLPFEENFVNNETYDQLLHK